MKNKEKYLQKKYELTPKQAEAVVLIITGHKQNHAARKTGISRNALNDRLDLACKKLKVESSKHLRLWWEKEKK